MAKIWERFSSKFSSKIASLFQLNYLIYLINLNIKDPLINNDLVKKIPTQRQTEILAQLAALKQV